VVTYLRDLPEISPESGEPADAETMAAGEIVYDLHCGTCHLPTGLGGPPGETEPGSYGVPLVGSAVVLAADPSALINSILYGARLPAPPFTSRRKLMDGQRDELSDLQIAQVASYVRGQWGHRAGAVTVEQVQAQR